MDQTLEWLRREILVIINMSNLANEITVHEIVLGGVPRVELSRRTDSETRYLQVAPALLASDPWRFAVLGGAYGNADASADFDGRRGGDGQYVLALVRDWLIDLHSWSELDNLPIPDGGK